MSTIGAHRWQQIAASLASKEARQEFVAATIRNRLPAQIREMRLARKWTQARLGFDAKMMQTAISRCESMGYDQFSLSTLKAIAAAFDVGLRVEFVPFSDLVHSAANPEIYGLNVPSYAHDAQLGQNMGAAFSSEYLEYNELGSTLGEQFSDIQELTEAPVIQAPTITEARRA